MKNDRSHWYDGQFFEMFIAPNQDRVFSHIKKIVMQNSSLLDIGCGTGRMAFQLADKCARIEGVDASRKNVAIAQRTLTNKPNRTLSFHHADALEFLSRVENRFDYATLSFVIHEMDEREREGVLRSLAAAADKVIMVDYLVPRQGGLRTIFDEAVEFVAGRDNYRNFRSFVDTGGLIGLSERAGLEVLGEVKSAGVSAHILIAAEREGDDGLMRR